MAHPVLAPICRDDQRRGLVVAHAVLNGIDFVEYERRTSPERHVLVVSFLKPVPAGAYGVTAHPDLVTVQGGTRIVGIRVATVTEVAGRLEIEVDKPGDFSVYTLAIGWRRQPDGAWVHVVPELDPQFSTAAVSFKAGCPVDFDCRTAEVCPPERAQEPLIDYLAKDYASFRQLLVDLIPQLNPRWLEHSPADLGIALIELLAYAGDHLSYFQDAVATEAYLATARQRLSARRHARLVDYRMHDGRNAWAFVHLATDSPGTVVQGSRIVTRITAPLRRLAAPPGVVIEGSPELESAFETDPALARARVFETTAPLEVHPENNRIFLHTWGNLECCLPRSARAAHLYSPRTLGGIELAVRPSLRAGDFLLLEEERDPLSGAAADADPAHRQVVELVEVEDTEDPAFGRQLLDGRPQLWTAGDRLPLLRVAWREKDALTFPLCISSRPPGRDPLLNLSVARGNMVAADDGRTITEVISRRDPKTGQPVPVPADRPFRLRLAGRPLTMQCQPEDHELGGPRPDLTCPPGKAHPAISLTLTFASGPDPAAWKAVPDLLDSSPFERLFVVETDGDGQATLRFGDGEYGREAAGAIEFTATYRIGNGHGGNVGAEALAHVVRGPLGLPDITSVRNPLPAQGGTDPETIEEVRQRAPAAFRAELFRAVTEADYVSAARKMPEVSGAVATFRWTGSWHTVFVGIDPRDSSNLEIEPGGRRRLRSDFERRVRSHLTRYKLAGYDLEIRAGEYVPLEIDIELCVAPDHFRGEVAAAVRRALGKEVNPDGTVGFFHPESFTFGQPVYLSRLYAAVESVEGVDSVFISRLRRFGRADSGELEGGVLPVGPWEIALLENDPNFMENGVLHILARGGK